MFYKEIKMLLPPLCLQRIYSSNNNDPKEWPYAGICCQDGMAINRHWSIHSLRGSCPPPPPPLLVTVQRGGGGVKRATQVE